MNSPVLSLIRFDPSKSGLFRVPLLWLSFSADLFHDLGDVDPDRAAADATPAAGAEGLTELVMVVLELVHEAVAITLRLLVARVVPRGVMGKLPEAAGVPAFSSFSPLLGPLIHDVETVAGRTDKGAGAAADTPGGDGVPGGILEMLFQPDLDLLQIKRLVAGGGERELRGVTRLAEQ